MMWKRNCYEWWQSALLLHPNNCSMLHSLKLSVAGAAFSWVSGVQARCLGDLQGVHLPRFRCDRCNREMKNEHSLNVHISRYHNEGGAPPQAVCPVCNKVYSNQYSLRTHMHLQEHSNQNCCNYFIRTCFDVKSFSFHFVHWHSDLNLFFPAQRSIVSVGPKEKRSEARL